MNQQAITTLQNHERVRCEIWTRVMGYHRPVSSWNLGKQSEHQERQFFHPQDAAAGGC
jgi:anaerobic ribonucleoside-triphosphate reductase